MFAKLMDIFGVLAWCFAVYVCVFDWEDARDGNKFPKTLQQDDSGDDEQDI